ncbi:efflux RND transporter permease subunit [Salinisphaera sp. P385]|uniref:Efflux RND transporter permease subunit n=1 Tax=Spectribacter acetivorans TaxID=3075603 RepID=A0ABU3B591_9GAMM|nr:efflux RND transporter permease subunit [Salinisphaera sp. P385]MDT0616997.1 efflux RND transporter permease subunit [Salinisphaera sp. P385]
MLEGLLRRPTLLAIGVLIICLFGIVAAFRVPVQMIPDLAVRTITVETAWPGATPQDVEKEILIEQEEYLRNVPSLQRMVSVARTGAAEIQLEFPFGVDANNALLRVSNALSQVPAYPENVDEPRLFATSFSQNSFMYYRIAPLPGNPMQVDMDMMQDFIDDRVRPLMERVPGVERVEVGGGAARQIQIHVDPARLAARNLTLTDVRAAVRERSRDITGGDIDSGKRRYLLRTIGRFADVEALGEVVLDRRGDAVIRLADVADIRLDHAEIREESFYNDKPNISLSVRRETGSNVIEIKKAMTRAIPGINEQVLEPAGMDIQLISDDVRYVQASVASVWRNLVIGAMLATMVMFLFLRSVPATLVGVIGIPICTIAAFLGLLMTGRTINVISLAGVAFAIGMTLDNSIVVLENIERARQRISDRFAAALAGVREVWPAVLASTMTTILVFAPVLFIEEEAGQLYSDISIAIASAIFVSMLVAIVVVPTASVRLPLRGVVADRNPRWQQRALSGVAWLLGSRARRFGCIGVTVAVMAAVIGLLTPPASYLPEGEEAKTFSSMIAPPGYNLSELSAIGEEVRETLVPHLNGDPARYEAGDTDIPPMRYLNMRINAEGMRIISEPVDPDHIDELMNAYNEIFRSYPGMRAFSTRGSIITSNDGGTRSVTLDIGGPSLAEIYQVATSAYDRAQTVFDNPQVRADPQTLTLAQPLLRVEPDHARLAEVGLDTEALGFSVAALADGAFVDEYILADNKVDIYLYDNRGRSTDIDALADRTIHTPLAGSQPITSLADFRQTVDTDVIRRLNGQRTVTLYIIPPPGVALETGVDAVEDDIIRAMRDEGEIPASVNVDISGASDQLDATRAALSDNYVIALLMSYLLLVAIFTHWGYPLLILVTIPLGVAGGIAGLAMMNLVGGWLPLLGLPALSQPFDMITMLGFLILMGTVVNNPILIVDQARLNRAGGMPIVDAVREAVATRLRPILMTTITTTFGLAPLVFLPGAGTELYRGVGAIVLFGLLFTMVITVTFLPALLVSVLQVGERLRGPARAAA